jgi:hypothetical protein
MRVLLMSCSRGIAALLACLFVISTLFLGAIIAFDRTFLQAAPLVDVLVKSEFYDQFHSAVSDQLVYSMTYNPCLEDPERCQSEGQEGEDEGQGGPPESFNRLDRDDWHHLLVGLLPPEWLEEQTASLMTQLNHQIEHPEADAGLYLDLTKLKGRLAGDVGLQSVNQIIQSQPPCQEGELERQIANLDPATGEIDLPDCLPPAESLEMMQPHLLTILSDVSTDIPDEVDLRPGAGGGGHASSGESGPNLLMILHWIRHLGRFGLLLPLGLLGLIALFAVRSWRDLCIWWGVPLLVTGLVGSVAALLGPNLLEMGLHTVLTENIPMGFSPGFVEFGLGVIQELIGAMLKWILYGGMGLTLSGLALLALSRRPLLVQARLARSGSPT